MTFKSDIYYMKQAIKQAKKAFAKGEIPIGAVVVSKEGKVIGRGYNLSESLNSQINHAEVRAINKASKKIEDWRLSNCTIYVTLQPCVMCMGLVGLSRIERIVYGAQSPLFGYFLDNESLPDLYKKHIRGITSGILSLESEALLKEFFKQKRVKNG